MSFIELKKYHYIYQGHRYHIPSFWSRIKKIASASIEIRTGAQKNGCFSLIERVILSAGAMLIFSVCFQIDQMPEG